MTAEPVGLKCPGCGEPPVVLFGGGTQAWCGTDDCPILTWNPRKTLAELNADSKTVDLENTQGGNGEHLRGAQPRSAGPGRLRGHET